MCLPLKSFPIRRWGSTREAGDRAPQPLNFMPLVTAQPLAARNSSSVSPVLYIRVAASTPT